jgi:NAD(P)H-flavin reductase
MNEVVSIQRRPSSPCQDPYLPRTAEVIERRAEGLRVTTLRLRFTDPAAVSYAFIPGQFNMLHGPDGDVPISIVAGNDRGYFEHCVRGVGNASRELASCRKGDLIGVRGPFGGGGWPLAAVEERDVVIISGGIGCAAVASAIDHIVAKRDRYGRLAILQGVTTDADHLYDDRYERWRLAPQTEVLLASMEGGPGWKGHKGLVTDLLTDDPGMRPDATAALICGPEVMVRPVVDRLLSLGLPPGAIHVSFERNMQCGIGHCARCQLGSRLVCRDGPVFSWDEIEPILRDAP